MHLVVFGHLLQRVGETVVGELLRDFEEAFVGQVEQGVGEVGGLSSEKVATSCSADCACPGTACSRTSPQLANVVGPFANGEALVLGLRRKS
jgi:hypothetical protein